MRSWKASANSGLSLVPVAGVAASVGPRRQRDPRPPAVGIQRVRTGSALNLIYRHPDKASQKAEKRYDKLGQFGLGFILVGTLAQAVGAYLSAVPVTR